VAGAFTHWPPQEFKNMTISVSRRAAMAAVAAAAASATVSPLAFAQSRTLRITAIPDESPTELARKAAQR
jgi:phosphonate transport system substrate-binding protein